jgi:diacylglycerol kinase family enzyme
LESDLGGFDLMETEGPGDATRRVRAILEAGSHDQILVAGGDGSINEAVNGYFIDGRPLGARIPLGVINLGTGGDFYRTLLKRSPDYAQARRENRFRWIDCGWSTLSGGQDPRAFVNITSIGLGGHVNRQMKRSSFQRGAAAYFWHSLTALLRYSAPPCRFRIKSIFGDWEEFEAPLVNFFVCNAECSGGGMRWAPRADFEDGLLDLVLVSGASKLQMIAESKRIYSGEIAQMTGVREFRATEVVVCPARTVSQEIDGEIREQGDAPHEYHFRIWPRAIPVIA